MNICTPGNCICDAAEWPGDTNCMGEVEGVDPWAGPFEHVERRYYFDEGLGVIISVEPHEMRTDTKYYYDPERTRRAWS